LPARQLNLDGLRDLLSVVNSSHGIDEILAYLVRKAHDVLESDGAAVYLFDTDDPAMLRAQASYGIASSLLADTTPVGYPVTGLAVSLRRPVVVADMAAALARGHAANVEEQFQDRGEFVEVTRPGPVSVDDVEQRHRNDSIATSFTTLIAVPLMAHDEIFGALELFYRDRLALGPEHIDISLAFAQQGALALENARLRTQAEQRLAEIGRRQRVAEGLRDLLAVVNSNHDLSQILAELLEQSSRLLGNEAGVIYLKEHDGDTILRVKASMGLRREQLADRVRIGSPTTGLAVKQARTLVCWDLSEALGDPSLAAADTQLEDFGSYARIVRLGPRTDPDLETDSPRQPRVRRLVNSFRAVVSTPLVARGRTLGAITLFHSSPHQFEREEVELVQAFAQQASLAIENAHLHAEAEQRMLENERRRRVAEAMRDLLAVVNSSRSVDEILSRVLEQTSDLLGSDAGSVLLVEKPGLLSVRASRALDSDLLPLRLPVGTAITGVSVERRRPTAVFDLSAAVPIPGQSEPEIHDRGGFLELRRVGDPGPAVVDADGFPRVAHIARHYKALLAVPLIVRGEVIGAVTLYYRTPREFSPEDVTLAEAFADQTALAMENARLFEQTQHVATIEERERLARELHDAVTQTLFSASLIAEVVPRLWDRDPDEGRQRVDDLRRLTRGALSEMRTLLLELRPAALVETPLLNLLSQLAETMISRTRVEVQVLAHGEPVALAPDVHVALYRIVQEALNNTVKHAAASHVRIHLCWRPAGVDLRVKDDGRGFARSEISRGRLGLGIMDERAQAIGASLRVRSKPALGTRVDLHWRPPS
jgi:signal transduction histidine kinase